jgi:signal transduction histidine kinase
MYEGNDGEEKVVFGDVSIIPTEDGYNTLTKKCKLNSIISMSQFTEGLAGNGAGVIFYKSQYASLALIRRTQVADVRWAGNPDYPTDPSIPGRLQPRISFELYIESAKNESRMWNLMDVEVAQYFFDRISQYLHTEMLNTFRLSLDQSNSECIQAIESSKEHYEFFAHMSHELRTPFHGVMSSLQILDTGAESIPYSEQREIIECALECGKTMLRTLDDILTIAKSRNSVECLKNPIIIAKILHSTARMMGPIAENKSVHFQNVTGKLIKNCSLSGEKDLQMSEIEWRSLVVLGDETRIAQITNNLTNNAIKFTPSNGSVTLTSQLLSFSEVCTKWKSVCSKYPFHYLSIDPLLSAVLIT